jgi:hypothetical protein
MHLNQAPRGLSAVVRSAGGLGEAKTRTVHHLATTLKQLGASTSAPDLSHVRRRKSRAVVSKPQRGVPLLMLDSLLSEMLTYSQSTLCTAHTCPAHTVIRRRS